MTKIKTKELIICIVAIMLLVLSIVTDVFATSVDELLGNTNNEVEQIPDRTNNVSNNVTNNTANNVMNNITNNTTNNATTNNTTKIPNAGVDYSIVFIIVVCGISTIYAYKKIREYNNF